MPSDIAYRPDPSDLDHLMTRIALSGLCQTEAVLAIEVMIHAINGDLLPPWCEIAAKYGFEKSHVSQAKKMLGLKLYESPAGYRINLDPALWFPKSQKGQAARSLAASIITLLGGDNAN